MWSNIGEPPEQRLVAVATVRPAGFGRTACVKAECPVNVDVATYKAEFLSHHYEGRVRPRAAYAMGLIYWWARLASSMPGVVNALAGWPASASVPISRAAWRSSELSLDLQGAPSKSSSYHDRISMRTGRLPCYDRTPSPTISPPRSRLQPLRFWRMPDIGS